MEADVLIGEDSGDSDVKGQGAVDERAVPEQRAAEREPPWKSAYKYICFHVSVFP